MFASTCSLWFGANLLLTYPHHTQSNYRTLSLSRFPGTTDKGIEAPTEGKDNHQPGDGERRPSASSCVHLVWTTTAARRARRAHEG
uniref:Putative secreted protein n=1 Tax=Ixodes ricinus TaxID=34613 RepID=A0A6B0U835_IXORI